MRTACLLLALVAACSGAFLKEGHNYIYTYQASVLAGSEDYARFASAFNITGTVNLQKSGNAIAVKMENVKFGAYNGEYSLFPQPSYTVKEYQELNPLTEPFSVTVGANSLVESITVSGDIPLWAQNIQRGLAAALQLDASKIQGQDTNFVSSEKTIFGECPTTYQKVVIDENTVQYRKFRSHPECANRPILVRKPGIQVTHCPDVDTKNVYNSTSYGLYQVSQINGEPVIKQVIVSSGVFFSPFGSTGHQQHSWNIATFILQGEPQSSGFTKIPAVSGGKTFDNLRYVFGFHPEQKTGDVDLTVPEPYYSHSLLSSTEPAQLSRNSDAVTQAINKIAQSLDNAKVFDDYREFHITSPTKVIPHISALDYASLKTLYNQFLGSGHAERLKNVPLQIFLDSLVVSGTSPAALLIRDIIVEQKDVGLTARLFSPLPNYIQSRSEKLVKEFEVLLSLPDASKHHARIISFAFASLINRVCKKSLCQSSGLLNTYVTRFSSNFDQARTFEEKNAAVLALSNIGIGEALQKLRTIVVNKDEERVVRVAAIGGLIPLASKDIQSFKEALLPIFYNRELHPELRNQAASIYLGVAANDKDIQQMALFMWTENCIQVKNYLYTLLNSMAYVARSCLANQASYAKGALKVFPPWTLDRTLSGAYYRDYYDREFGFGHMTRLSVQKSGESVFPTSFVLSLNGISGGYSSTYITVAVRIEGLGKAVADRIMSMTTGQFNFDDVKSKVFDKIGVVERNAPPLKVELLVALHKSVIAYHAADASTITSIPDLIKKLQDLKSTYDLHFTRTILLGEVKVEEPSGLGTPITLITGVSAIVSANINVVREKQGTQMTQTSAMRFQSGAFGVSSLMNHLPPLGSIHAVTALRTARSRIPRKYSLGVDVKQLSLSFSIDPPTEEDPVIIQSHAQAITHVMQDHTVTKSLPDLLKSSCPTCQPVAVISKGAQYRKDRDLSLPKIPNLGLGIVSSYKSGVKYIDCEKPNSRVQTIKKLAKYFSEENKNTGGLPLVRVLLGFQYMKDSLFFSPLTQSCGIKAFRYLDKSGDSVLEKFEGSIRGKYTTDDKKKLGTKIQLKASFSLKFGGKIPKTKTVDLSGGANFVGYNEKREIKLKFTTKDDEGNNKILCVDVNTQLKKAVDMLSFEGENEPTFDRSIKLVWGPEAQTKDNCPLDGSYLTISRKAVRSQEQVELAASNAWPYKQCREQRGSAQWPGQLTPPTYECMMAVHEQTHLRQNNISLEYKLDEETKNILKKPKAVLTAVLTPYWQSSPAASAVGHHHHSTAAPGVTQVEIDFDASSNSPSLDIHYHGSNGNNEHFHDIELEALPEAIRPKPVSARFTGAYRAVKYGLYAYCVNSPSSVVTFDNVTYGAELNECPTLLAGDCDQKPQFAILSRKIAPSKIAVTLHLGEHVIELQDLDSATVDNEKVLLSDNVYADPNEAKVFKIVKHTPSAVFVGAEKLSVFVYYTGEYVTVTVGSRYRSTACGLCGNFDGDKRNEFLGPQGETCKKVITPADFVKSYVVRDGSCAGVGSPCP